MWQAIVASVVTYLAQRGFKIFVAGVTITALIGSYMAFYYAVKTVYAEWFIPAMPPIAVGLLAKINYALPVEETIQLMLAAVPQQFVIMAAKVTWQRTLIAAQVMSRANT